MLTLFMSHMFLSGIININVNMYTHIVLKIIIKYKYDICTVSRIKKTHSKYLIIIKIIIQFYPK